MKPVISIDGLSKRYRIGGPTREGLRHVVDRAVTSALERMRGQHRRSAVEDLREFWALRDVSFDVRPGEVVGIIGRNGAGKTTLLKIISRITEPTAGRVVLRGRVASLLEVGTGFHPELTGRENVFLNGAILGMPRAEIRRKFDEIVAFAEVERFLDTPVKRYSTGMHMRLAFAVAAHLEPDVLIVDEVLAVGDAAFQKKCLGKMESVAGEGRTVLFVSHNMAAVQRLCESCRLLESGRLVSEGPAPAIVAEYLDRAATSNAHVAIQEGTMCDVRVRVLDPDGAPTSLWSVDEPLQIEVTLTPDRPLRRPAVDLAFYADRRTRLFALESDRLHTAPDVLDGTWTITFTVMNPGFAVPEMFFDVGIREAHGHYLWLLCDAGRLSADYQSLPSSARGDTLLHLQSSANWTRQPLEIGEAVH